MNLGNIAPEQAHHLIYAPIGLVRVALDDSPQNGGVGFKNLSSFLFESKFSDLLSV